MHIARRRLSLLVLAAGLVRSAAQPPTNASGVASAKPAWRPETTPEALPAGPAGVSLVPEEQRGRRERVLDDLGTVCSAPWQATLRCATSFYIFSILYFLLTIAPV